MLVLKILAVLLGAAFLSFGYAIYFRGKYFLINGFEAAYREGRRDSAYAKRVGLIELVLGILLLVTAALLILFA